ncbi:MAG: hypothetical protein AAF631_00740 [Pseudomonadota bacterium]
MPEELVESELFVALAEARVAMFLLNFGGNPGSISVLVPLTGAMFQIAYAHVRTVMSLTPGPGLSAANKRRVLTRPTGCHATVRLLLRPKNKELSPGERGFMLD